MTVLKGVVRARILTRATMRNIPQNLVFAFADNAIGIPIAACVLYPTFGILLSPMVSALVMSLSSISVIANALRLGRLRLVPDIPSHAFPAARRAAIACGGPDARHPVP